MLPPYLQFVEKKIPGILFRDIAQPLAQGLQDDLGIVAALHDQCGNLQGGKVLRRILAQLKNAGLITVARGTGGIEPTKPLEEISFYDVYQAIDPVEDGDLFHFHEAPNPKCPVGRNIHALLDDKLTAIQNAMEDEMRKYTLADLREGMHDLLAKEN